MLLAVISILDFGFWIFQNYAYGRLTPTVQAVLIRCLGVFFIRRRFYSGGTLDIKKRQDGGTLDIKTPLNRRGTKACAHPQLSIIYPSMQKLDVGARAFERAHELDEWDRFRRSRLQVVRQHQLK